MTIINVHDRAVAYMGEIQVFYAGDDFVEVSPVPAADLAACSEGRFVPPGGQWVGAADKLEAIGTLIVTGERGSGRRTAALRLLSGASATGPIYDLTPTWRRPGTKVLPAVSPGARCLLDMSEPTEDPAPSDFSSKLVNWAREHAVCLVVVATDENAAGRWAGNAGVAAIRLRSPDARALAEGEIRVAGAGEMRVAILDNVAFESIWKSAPKAEDACRLARLIFEGADRNPADIADEYRGWQKWIDDNIPKDFGARTLMWAAAFCDGGRRKSVLQMSEDLRRLLLEDRKPAAILSDAPSSQRLDAAKIKRDGDRAWLSPAQHGLAAALRAYLWDEFEDQALREILTNWLVAQLGELPLDDAERVAQGVLDIVIRFRDDTLLRALRDKLTGDKRPIAVRVLSQAALDPRFGSHVRESLYDWARTTKSQAVIDLVAEVCGSTFGEQKPGMALVRLGWAAQNSQPGSPALATALASIGSRHPEEVTTSLTKWFADYDPPTAGINAFLAVAGTKQGAVLLCSRADPANDDSGFRDALISYFQRSLAESASYETAISVLKIWEELSAEGTLDPRTAINLLGRAIEPEFGNKTIERVHPGTWDTESFWGQAFRVALTGKDIGPKVDVSHNADEPMVSIVISDEETGAGEPTYAPAMPATPTGEETDASAQAG